MKTQVPVFKLVTFIVICVFGLVVTGIIVTEARIESTKTYRAVFENASGLEVGDTVRIAGAPVGKVVEVQIHGQKKALATFKVQSRQQVMQGSRAEVRYENLIGHRYLELMEGAGPNRPLEEGGTLPASQTAPALDLDDLLGGLSPTFDALSPAQVNEFTANLIAVLQGESGSIEGLLRSTASLTNTVADRDAVIGRVINQLNTVVGTMNERDQEFSSTVSELQRLVSGLSADRRQIGASLAKINTMSGSVAELLPKVRDPLKGTITGLHRTATILDDNSYTLDRVLRKLPGAYMKLSRFGAYGNFFNFYLCSVRVKLTGPDGKPMMTPEFSSNEQTERCQGSS
ncbi:MAG: MCE family protein [Rhodospirillales bacterium]|nr:MCE family protein [Rhodospirillales bacterium]